MIHQDAILKESSLDMCMPTVINLKEQLEIAATNPAHTINILPIDLLTTYEIMGLSFNPISHGDYHTFSLFNLTIYYY